MPAAGFTVKSGWAVAVLVGGAAGSPALLDCRRILLSDPAIPDSKQPYHAGFGTARGAGAGLTRLLQSVKIFGGRSVRDVLDDYQSLAHGPLAGAGLVVGSTVDPATIANDHIRIHALEGRLFRGVIEDAAARRGLCCTLWRERDLYGAAAGALRRPEAVLRRTLGDLGREAGGPWRVEQKAAALAAWLVIASRPSSSRRRASG